MESTFDIAGESHELTDGTGGINGDRVCCWVVRVMFSGTL